MKIKTLMLMLGIFLCGTAQAEWVKIGVGGNTTSYADPATIRKVGNKAKMWVLFDLRTVQLDISGKRYMSIMQQVEFDCKNEQRRSLYQTWHSKNIHKGKVVQTFDDPDMKWKPVPPGTLNKSLWEFACKKK